jgi:uncharacterized protein YggE
MERHTHIKLAVVLAAGTALAVSACGSAPSSPKALNPASTPAVLASSSTSSNGGGSSMATVTTQGTGTVSGAPDTLTIGIGVSTTAPHAAQALSENNQIADAVQAALRAGGVPAVDVQTTGLSLQQNWNGNAPDGYAVFDEVTATLHDLSRAGTVIDAALAPAGDSGRLDNAQLSMSDSNPLMDAARRRAVTSARVQAQQIATAAGGRLGPLVSLTDQPQQQQGPEYASAGAAISSGAAAPVPIQPGTQKVSVEVVGTWQVLPAG